MTNQLRTTSQVPEWPLTLKISVLAFILFFLWLFNRDYITPIALGFIMATLTYPIYVMVHSKAFGGGSKSRGISSLLTIFGLCIIIGFILNIITREIIKEIPKFADDVLTFARTLPENQSVTNLLANVGIGRETIQTIVSNFNEQVTSIARLFGAERGNGGVVNEQELNRVLSFSRQFFNIVFNQLVYLVIFILAWLNGLLFGRNWVHNLLSLIPLSNNEKKSIAINLKEGIRNVIYANLLSGLVHASFCFVLMFLFGIPNLFIITLIIFLIGILPLSPSELGYAIPFLLIFPINPPLILLLIPIAEIIILWVNNVLIPRIIASGQEGNPLLILTSILSGITLFGLMGFIIGPVIMIFIQTLYRIFVSRVQHVSIDEV